MIKEKEFFNEQNDDIKERYELAIERISDIINEETVEEPYLDYFKQVSKFITMISDFNHIIEEDGLNNKTIEELQELNKRLYEDIEGENYLTSYANPEYARKKLGEKYDQLLCFLYTELRGLIVYTFEKRTRDITIFLELFIEIYNYFENENDYTYKDVKSAIYYFMSDYSDVLVDYRTRELLDPSLTFATDIIMKEDLSDLRYLYKFGEYITENELKTAAYLNSLPEQKIKEMAETYTEGFRRGFEVNNIDLSKKSTLTIRYSIGFERIVRAAIHNFNKMGLSTIIFRAAVSSINKKQHLKIGYYSTSPNKQYDYDHRFDHALYFDKAFVERKLVSLKGSYERQKDLAKRYAGPAVMETFGEHLFEPLSKPECISLDEKQQKLSVTYNRDAELITNEYIKSDEYSFTIIAYPVPEIGEDFEAIFDEIVKINTLDNELYTNIQQHIIDALDKGDYVRVTGANGNKTDIKINLYKLKDKEKETIFENCVADVNIPVGEVFTSPVLEKTCGTLHVKEVFLNDLKYTDLELIFEDGMIKDYTCKNYEDERENKKFVKENLMHNQDTLPIGEFAIGTNTTAYVVGKKYGISEKLPILIAEKTGPHFAVGDTCYKMSEDLRLFNPDGKEIVAKDNTCSILRKTEIEKAYYNCHTDITIPYHELGDIVIHTESGEEIILIKNGRFVLAGTEKLNEAFL